MELKKYINNTEYESQVHKDKVEITTAEVSDLQKQLNSSHYEFDILRHKVERSSLNHNEMLQEFQRFDKFVGDIKEESLKKERLKEQRMEAERNLKNALFLLEDSQDRPSSPNYRRSFYRKSKIINTSVNF